MCCIIYHSVSRSFQCLTYCCTPYLSILALYQHQFDINWFLTSTALSLTPPTSSRLHQLTTVLTWRSLYLSADPLSVFPLLLPLLCPPFPRCFHTHNNLQSLEDLVFRYVIVSPAVSKNRSQIPRKPGAERTIPSRHPWFTLRALAPNAILRLVVIVLLMMMTMKMIMVQTVDKCFTDSQAALG